MSSDDGLPRFYSVVVVNRAFVFDSNIQAHPQLESLCSLGSEKPIICIPGVLITMIPINQARKRTLHDIWVEEKRFSYG
jgi:hypothetical protein